MFKQMKLGWLIPSLLFTLFLSFQTQVVQAKNLLTVLGQVEAVVEQDVAPVFPLPPGCIGSTPGDATDLCLNGFVYMDGQVIVGARVDIQSATKRATIFTTAKETEVDKRPHCEILLSALDVQAGSTITLTVSYGDRTQTVTHTVEGGYQQIDIVLPHRLLEQDYMLLTEIGDRDSESKYPVRAGGIAVDMEDNVYVVDQQNARILVYDDKGRYLRHWGSHGNLPGQLNWPVGIAIDRKNQVYITDIGSQLIHKFTKDGTWLHSWLPYSNSSGVPTLLGTIATYDKTIYIFVENSINNCSIQKFTDIGSFDISWNSNCIDKFDLHGMTIDRDGFVYILDSKNEAYRIYKYKPNGVLEKSWGDSTQKGGQLSRLDSIAVDKNGYIYVAESDTHQIKQFDSMGVFNGVWNKPNNRTLSLDAPLFLAASPNQGIYLSDYNGRRIQKFSSSGDLQIGWGISKDLIQSPHDIAADNSGHIYVLSTINGIDIIQIFDVTGNFIESVSFTHNITSTHCTICRLAIDSMGSVYAVDSVNYSIHKLDHQGNILSKWTGKNVQFQLVRGVSIDSVGNVYFAADGYIHKFSTSGDFVKKWGNNGIEDAWFAINGISISEHDELYAFGDTFVQRFNLDGIFQAGWNSGLGYITDVAIADDGYIYLSDGTNDRVQKYDSFGNLQTSWYGGQTAFIQPLHIVVDDHNELYVFSDYTLGVQLVNNTDYNHPADIVVARTGDLYITYVNRNSIQKFDSAGNFKGYWGDHGSEYINFSNRVNTAISVDGHIYVAYEETIKEFNDQGRVLLGWEVPSIGGDEGVNGIAVDFENNLYVADDNSSLIRKYTSTGQEEKPIDRPGTERFGTLIDVAVDDMGTIYVLDYTGQNRIHEFDQTGTHKISWLVQNNAGVLLGQKNLELINLGNQTLYIVVYSNNRAKEIWEFASRGNFIAHKPVYHSKCQQRQAIALDSLENIYSLDLEFRSIEDEDIPEFCLGQIQTFRPMTYTAPVATITETSLNARNLGFTETLRLRGEGQVSDAAANITAYRWVSNKNGEIGTGSLLNKLGSELTPGAHTIQFSVQDSQGQWSKAVETHIFVRRNVPLIPPTPTLVVTPAPGVTPAPTPPLDPNAPTSWTFLLYFVCDYKDDGRLEGHCLQALHALTNTVSLNPNVQIAIQFDGSKSIGTGVQDTQRWLIRPGATATSEAIGESRMDEPSTLTEFVQWGQAKLPAAHYYLAIIDHGQGVKGIGWDDSSGGLQRNFLTPGEIAQALKSEKDLQPIDVLHFDACSMGLLEVAFQLREVTNYLITSQYLGWSFFAYAEYQQQVTFATSPRQLAEMIAKTYADLATNYPNKAGGIGLPYTLSVLDLHGAEPVNSALHEIVRFLIEWVKRDANHAAAKLAFLDDVRARSQQFESDNNYDINELDAYIDLAEWATLLQSANISDSVNVAVIDHTLFDLAQAEATKLLALLPKLVVAHHTSTQTILSPIYLPPEQQKRYTEGILVDLARSHGISIYYPYASRVPQIASSTARQAGSEQRLNETYDDYINDRTFDLTRASFWNEFLRLVVGEQKTVTEQEPEPGPLAPLTAVRQLFLPLIRR